LTSEAIIIAGRLRQTARSLNPLLDYDRYQFPTDTIIVAVHMQRQIDRLEQMVNDLIHPPTPCPPRTATGAEPGPTALPKRRPKR